MPDRVRIVEVGPRDGLQNEPETIPTERKLEFIAGLIDAGLKHIEVTSFVHPKAVPQLADADQLVTRLPPREGVVFSALVPNARGLQRAAAAGVRHIAVFTGASDSFTTKNINMTIAQSLEEFGRVVPAALASGMDVRGYVSTAFACPYDGRVPKERVLQVAQQLIDIGVQEIVVSDTIGAAVPGDVFETVGYLQQHLPPERLALHFHDTSGTALANVLAGLQLGVGVFDASAGGLGGCPYAPGAAGNLATEDLVYMLQGMGIQTGVQLGRLAEASRIIAGILGRPLPSRQLRRLDAK